MSSRGLSVVWPILVVACAATLANAAECPDLMPGKPGSAGVSRAIQPEDLARVRDIGQPEVESAGLSLSPDQTRIAFQMRRADPETNSYCQGIVVVDIGKPGAVHAVDVGGDYWKGSYYRWGIAAYPSGIPTLVTPRWSPDGKWLAYVRWDRGRAAVWRARSDGHGAEALTQDDLGFEDVAWSRDGASLILVARPALLEAERAIDSEGTRGYHFDERAVPLAGGRPFPLDPIPRIYEVLDIATRGMRPATPEERALLEPSVNPSWPKGAERYIHDESGNRAWTLADEQGIFLAPARLHAQKQHQQPVRCAADSCNGHILGLWWKDGELYFLRREGPAFGSMALYRWAAGAADPARLFVTDSLLMDCNMTQPGLICAQEDARQPRRVVLVDPRSGRQTSIFEPNPEFARFRLGTVRRLYFSSDSGSGTHADLVLPPDYEPHRRYPMVIVQYTSRGFLRGGSGDEYPIFPLAARGFVVMSFQRPRYPTVLAHDVFESYRHEVLGWSDRRNVQAALQNGIQSVIRAGVADPARVGITGQSDGSATAAFALINSKIFAAAAMSTCCEDPFTVMTVTGISGAMIYRKANYPPLSRPDPQFWSEASVAANAGRISVPLLLQLSDDEYLLSLQSVVSLRENNKVVDTYIFPDERHAKWQAAHRLAIYKRNIAWFDFWLQGREDSDLVDDSELARWRSFPKPTR